MYSDLTRSDSALCRRCPERQGVITKFAYNKTTGTADATIASMYRFPDTNQVNFQCDVVICKGEYSRVEVVEWSGRLTRSGKGRG